MINLKNVKKLCKDDFSLIENYDKAIADDTQVWDCHHRRETIYSVKDLQDIGEYYNRPACELIFLTKSEHTRLHHLGKHHSAETRYKISESLSSEKNPLFGKHHSAEARKKMSEAHKGKHHSAETRQKIAEAHKDITFSEETRKKMSEARKGKHWYNNGMQNVFTYECPEGFVQGRK